MIPVIAVTNQKGGVGKTMFSDHLAEFCAESMRVLFVDLDGQANSTRFFGADRATNGKGASALFTNGPGPDVVELRPNLSLIASDRALDDLEASAIDIALMPRKHLTRLGAGYGIIIMDTPPTRGRRLLGALTAASAVVTPLSLDKSSFDGLADLLADIKAVRTRANTGLKHIGILVNLYDPRSKDQRANLTELQSHVGDRVLSTVLHRRASVAAAFNNCHPVWKKMNGESARKAGSEFRAACDLVYRRAVA